MELRLQKLDKRGGLRTKKKNPHPYSVLIGAIWDKFGGIKKVSDHLNIPYQSLINFRLRGRVPLARVHEIADGLGVPHWGLNFSDLKRMYPNDIPSWVDVVRSYKLKKVQELKILRMP